MRQRPETAVDGRDQIVGDKPFPVARRRRAGVHAALHARCVRRDDDELAEALGGGETIGALLERECLIDECVLASAVAVKQVDRRKASLLVAGVAGREVHRDCALRRFALPISFERLATYRDSFNRARRRARAAPGARRAAWRTTPPLGLGYGARGDHERDRHGERKRAPWLHGVFTRLV